MDNVEIITESNLIKITKEKLEELDHKIKYWNDFTKNI